jgi:hypothetical protein
MRGTLGAIHDKQLCKRILEALGETIDSVLQIPFWQRLVFVEQRHDENRNDGHHDERETEHEYPNIDVKVRAPHLHTSSHSEHNLLDMGAI